MFHGLGCGTMEQNHIIIDLQSVRVFVRGTKVEHERFPVKQNFHPKSTIKVKEVFRFLN